MSQCFTRIDAPELAQRLLGEQLRTAWPAMLETLRQRIHPLHEEIFRASPMSYWWVAYQTEWATDLLAPPYKKFMIKTEGGNSILLDDSPGIGGITLETAGGQKLAMTSISIELDNGSGGSIKMQGPQVSVNSGALEVT